MISLDNLILRYNQLQGERAEVDRKLGEELRTILETFLAENKSIKEIRWTQYTPYFNDGDTCEFSVEELYFSTKKTTEDWDNSDHVFQCWHDYKGFKEYHPLLRLSKTTYENCKKLDEVLKSMEGVLHTLFGDHVEVIVNGSGIDIEEYDHD